FSGTELFPSGLSRLRGNTSVPLRGNTSVPLRGNGPAYRFAATDQRAGISKGTRFGDDGEAGLRTYSARCVGLQQKTLASTSLQSTTPGNPDLDFAAEPDG